MRMAGRVRLSNGENNILFYCLSKTDKTKKKVPKDSIVKCRAVHNGKLIKSKGAFRTSESPYLIWLSIVSEDEVFS